MNRRQRVTIGCSRSDWLEMNKCFPQGSVLGPLIFNTFINDIIFYLRGDCSIFNYGDELINIMRVQLVKCTEKAITWFASNHMKYNTSKFQTMIMKPCPGTGPIMVDINGQSVQPID